MLERRRWKNENFSDRSIFPSKETRFSPFSNFLSYFSYYFSILLLFLIFPQYFLIVFLWPYSILDTLKIFNFAPKLGLVHLKIQLIWFKAIQISNFKYLLIFTNFPRRPTSIRIFRPFIKLSFTLIRFQYDIATCPL